MTDRTHGDDVIKGSNLLDEFARSDGFGNWQAMYAFWREHHGPMFMFDGVLIRWADFHG